MLNAKVTHDGKGTTVQVEYEGDMARIVNDTCNLIRATHDLIAKESLDDAAHYRTAVQGVVSGTRMWERIPVKEDGA